MKQTDTLETNSESAGQSRKKILIVDDHRLFADGLQLILEQLDPCLVITTKYESDNIQETIDILAEFDLVLIDLQMPGFDGFSLLEAINARKLKTKVLIISGSENKSDIERTLSLGARGFVPKSAESQLILKGIHTVLDGNRYVPDPLSYEINWPTLESDSSCNHDAISVANGSGVELIRPRQLEVLKLMSDGHTNSQIADILGISLSAVKSHVAILFKALGVRNRTSCIKAGGEKSLL